jgi:Zn-dependent peptidase ImmA (M78 family)
MAFRKRKIDSLVETLLDEHNVKDGPVPIAAIARSRRARIHADALEGDLSGFLFREDGSAVIGVNTLHPQTRQTFTIGHELGHLLLHDQDQLHLDRGFPVRLRNSLSSEGTDEAEREANYFAAALLMPKRFLERDLSNQEFLDLTDDSTVKTLSRKYGVSTVALVNRLKNLGYIVE